jgi:hypothetical protein
VSARQNATFCRLEVIITIIERYKFMPSHGVTGVTDDVERGMDMDVSSSADLGVSDAQVGRHHRRQPQMAIIEPVARWSAVVGAFGGGRLSATSTARRYVLRAQPWEL